MSSIRGVALITGSAQGIGRGIALRLAKDGFDIALNDLPSRRDQLRAVADEIEKIGRRTLLVPGDVSVEEEVKEMVQEVSKELGGLDVMVANAGIGGFASFVSTELEDWERIMAVNARGPFLCYKYAAQQMIKQGRGGRIIGASSAAGKLGGPLIAAYCASKFAVRGLTQVAALELGRYNITVNCYAPGIIETPLSAGLFDNGGVFMNSDPELANFFRSRVDATPIKYKGQPEDVANLVGYLASKEAHFITGKYPFNFISMPTLLHEPGQGNAFPLTEELRCLDPSWNNRSLAKERKMADNTQDDLVQIKENTAGNLEDA